MIASLTSESHCPTLSCPEKEVPKQQKERLALASLTTQTWNNSEKSLELLCKDNLHRSTQCDHQNVKNHPFHRKFKYTGESGCNNGCWVQEELRRRGLQIPLSAAGLENGDFGVGYTERKPSRFCKEGEEEEEEKEVLFLSNNNYKNIKNFTIEDVTVVDLLKACVKQKDLHKGRRIHADIVQRGLLERNIFIGNSLVNLYAKCGALVKAQEVFDELHARNVVTWNGLITGYAQHGHGEIALASFEQMQFEGISPNYVTFLATLKACVSIGAVDKSQEIHAEIVKEGFLEENIVLSNAFIDMYAKCGMLGKAQEVFDHLLVRDIVTWNSLINGYAQYEHCEEVLNYFECMQHQGVSPDAITFVCSLKACGSIGAVCRGQEIHARIASVKLSDDNNVVATALIDMYAKCGMLVKAQEVFDKLVTRVVISWNALIAGYIQHEHFDDALSCFKQMQLDGFLPDGVTFLCILKACGSIRAMDKGLEVHAEIAREGLWEKDTVIANALIDMYAKCGLIGNAQEVFDKLVSRNVVSWNVLMAGFAQDMHSERALDCFRQMQCEGFSPDVVTFVCTLKACGSLKAAHEGQEIHAQIVKMGLLEEETVVFNAVIDLYATCGMLAEAEDVFDKLIVWTVASWNTLIAGFVQYEHDEEALNTFECMQAYDFSPNIITFMSTLKACGSIGAAYKGQGLHSEIVKQGLREGDMVAGTALVDMYANCGMLAEAQEVFDKLPTQDLVLWNVLIAGYAQLGQVETAFSAVDKMIRGGLSPDVSTFTIVLNACNHTGLLDKGQTYFEIMRTSYGIFPNSEHYNCVVDLFARVGHLDKAVALIKEMPFCASVRVWHIMLGASQKCGNIKLGRMAFAHAARLNEVDAAAYVFLSNTLAACKEERVDIESEEGSMEMARALLVD